jgi:hypothetical protein
MTKKEKEGKMKKGVLFIICALFACCAVRADNVITSLEYVKNQTEGNEQLGIVGLLDKEQIPAKNTDTVLMHTGVSGTVGEKGIYNASNAYSEQTGNLVTAGAFNTAVQNALDTEFVCIDWDVATGGCLLYKIHNSAQKQTLPAGYTQLEYLESTGAQCINTGIPPTSDVGVSVKYAFTEIGPYYHVFGTLSPHFYGGLTSTAAAMSLSFGETQNTTVLSMPAGTIQLNTPYTATINLYNSKKAAFADLSQTAIDRPAFDANGQTIMMFCSSSYDGNVATPSHYLKGRIYNMQITNGSALVRNFIPARRNSDDVLGMYDTVSGTFFTNTCWGKFIAGPVFGYLPQGNE